MEDTIYEGIRLEDLPRFHSIPRNIELNADKFNEFISHYPRELTIIETDFDGNVYRRYVDRQLHNSKEFGTVAFSREPKDESEESPYYNVVINYKKLFEEVEASNME